MVRPDGGRGFRADEKRALEPREDREDARRAPLGEGDPSEKASRRVIRETPTTTTVRRPHTPQKGANPQRRRHQTRAGTWGSRRSHAWLAGTRHGAASAKGSLEGNVYKVQHPHTVRSATTPRGLHLKEWRSHVHVDFKAALFITDQVWKPPRRPSAGEG